MTELEDRRKLREVIARIELLSHVPAANTGRSSRSADDEIGGRRPSGGVVAKDDFAEGFSLKSAEHFRRRMSRCYTHRAVTELLREAEMTLGAWKRTPLPAGQEPEYGTTQWKRFIAQSQEDSAELARRFNCTKRYINKIRKAMREGGVMPLDEKPRTT